MARDPMPACTRKYHPTTGGYSGNAFESAGDTGQKGEGGGSPPSGDKVEGVYNHDKVRSHGNYPHSGEDPDNMTGPPLAGGYTDEDPTRSGY